MRGWTTVELEELLDSYRQKTSSALPGSEPEKPQKAAYSPPASVLSFSSDRNRIVYQKGNENEEHPGGLGFPVFIYHLLDLIRKEELSWRNEVTVNGYAAQEARQPNALGLANMEKVNLLTLYKAAVVSNSPDAIVALAGHVYEIIGKSKNKTIPALRKIAASWNVPESSIKNVTGRYYDSNPQYYTTEMLLKVAVHLLAFDLKGFLNQKNISYKDKYFEADSVLGNAPVSSYLSYSTGLAINTVCKCDFNDETIFIAVCGAKTALERDQLVLEAIHRSRMPLPEPDEQFIAAGKPVITICGDTYCGERYTKWRIARNIDDPMQRYGDDGYTYSFEKVASLITQKTYNIVNSECVLSPTFDESQQTGKYLDFVLGAHPKKTIACYKKENIDAVMLANNHAMDFGAVGCRQTRKFFLEAGLNPIGTGRNIDEAEKPLLLEVNGRQVIIFNAYCYYLEKRHKLFRHYCMGANTGTAFGTDQLDDMSLWRRMKSYRTKYRDAFIVFSPHWSTDFNKRHLQLRPIASRAFSSGVDLIIGHGPHIPIGAEHIDGKLCIYSLGNFVFNTTGIDMDASGQSPYGIVAQIDFSRKEPELKLYPIYVHNLNTFFQPYPIGNEEQLAEFTSSLLGMNKFIAGRDDIGYYLSIDVV